MKNSPWPPAAYFPLFLVIFLCLAMGLAAWRFLAEPDAAFGPAPLLTLDAGTHVEHHRITASMEEATGRPWGYNAGYVAGYGHTYELSVPILGTLLYRAFHGWASLAAWRWLEYFVPIVLLPLAVFWAARAWGLGGRRSLFAACWASGYVWLGFPCLFVLAGPTDKMLALALAVGAGLLADAAWARGGWRRGIAAVLAAVLAGYLHRSSVLWTGLMTAASWTLQLPYHRGWKRMVLWPAAAALLGALASAPWLLPLLRFWGGMDPDIPRSLSFQRTHLLSILGPLVPRGTLDGQARVLWGSALLQVAPWVLGLSGSLLRYRRDRLSRLTVLCVALLLLFSVLSVRVQRLQIFEPATFFFPATLLLILRSLAIGAAPRRHTRAARLAVPGIAAATLCLAWAAPSYQTMIRTYGLYPSTRVPDALRTTAQLIRAQAPDESRIAVEEQRNPFDTRDRFHMVYPMAVLGPDTGRMFLGYPCPLQIRGSVASFLDGRLLGLDLRTCDPGELGKRLRDYNVGWVVAYTPAIAARLASMPDVMRLAAEQDGVRLFRAAGDRSWFCRGAGEVRFLPGVIRLENLEPEGGSVILKAHFAPGLRATPWAEIRRHPVPGDSAGFIEILDPPENLEIGMSLF